MPDHREIYSRHAEQYQRLVAREDPRGNILRALTGIHPLRGACVVELGAGTGRLARMLAPLVERVWLFDISPHMLGFATKVLAADGAANWRVAAADHRRLPLTDGMADVVISGWSLCYLMLWSGEGWRSELGRAIREMERVLRAEGPIILLETLGAGCEKPRAPKKLREYYSYLERQGFNRRWIRTDFEFKSLEEAQELMGFFFGENMAARVAQEGWVRVPECTGIWWRG